MTNTPSALCIFFDDVMIDLIYKNPYPDLVEFVMRDLNVARFNYLLWLERNLN